MGTSGGLQKALRVMRAERDLTQKALAEAADLSAAYVSQIESGLKRPSMDSLEKLAAALEVPSSELLARAELADAEFAAGGQAGGLAPAGESAMVAMEQPSFAASTVGSSVLPRALGSRHRGRARELADGVLRDRDRARGLAQEARAKEQEAESWRLGDVREDLRTLIDLLDAYASGRYRAVPWESLILVVAGLQYYVNPEDVVPDYLEEGYLDDAAVLAFVAEMVAPDLDTFTG